LGATDCGNIAELLLRSHNAGFNKNRAFELTDMIQALVDTRIVLHAEPADPGHGVHTLLKCHEPAVHALESGTVMRAPRIILGLGTRGPNRHFCRLPFRNKQ